MLYVLRRGGEVVSWNCRLAEDPTSINELYPYTYCTVVILFGPSFVTLKESNGTIFSG